MSRGYPLAVNAATALAEGASRLDRTTRQALVDALKRDQAKLVLVAQRAQQAQVLSTFLCLLSLYRACQVSGIRQALAPLLDESELAVLDEVVHAHLSALLDRQAVANQVVVAWFSQKGE